MSLILNRGTNPPVRLKTFTAKSVSIGDNEISIEDFCETVKYVLTNTDLVDKDPRLDLVKKIKQAKKVSGFNKDGKRLSLL